METHPGPSNSSATSAASTPDNWPSASGVDEQRVLAIVLGRWTPSPEDRDAIAAVFGLTREQIAWGHKTPIQHLYGQGPA